MTTTTTSTTTSTTSTSTTSNTPPPTHIPTWAYDDGCNGGTGASPSLVDNWVTYAESNCGPAATKALTDCTQAGVSYCTAVAYLDANDIYATGSVPVASAAQENWWQHEPGFTDSAHRISFPSYGGGNALNQGSQAVDQWFQNYVQTSYNSYPALMMDDSGASLRSELYGSGYTTSDEISADAQLQADHEQMAREMTHTDGSAFLQIDNALTPNDYLAVPFSMLNDPASVQGLIAEGAPISNGTITNYYSTLLDDMAYVDQTANDFVVLLSYDPSGSLVARRVQEATVLLGYSPGHTVSWADLEQNINNLAVWPEEGIVPTDPVQSMSGPSGTDCLAGQGVVCSTGGHNNLQVATGVYRREFAQCYNQGAAIGACSTIVNDTNSPVVVQQSWLTQTYGHEIAMNGGDLQSDGTLSLNSTTFTPGAATVPADDALLLAR